MTRADRSHTIRSVPRLISSELAKFLESGVSVLVATRDGRMQPECARAVGARLEAGGDEVTVFLPVATSMRVVANLGENGRIAVCFASVDHRGIQVKGQVLGVAPADACDRQLVDRYRAAVAQEWGFVGLPPRITYRMNHWPCHAVRLRIEAVYVQTPGPGAGEPLRAAR